jgi:foldase protein PrsA
MTKKIKKRAPKPLTRKQRSNLEREQHIERILIWSVVFIGIAVVGVLGYGLVVEKIIKARQPVAVVGDTPIKTSEFQARVRFIRLQMRNQLQYLYQQQQTIDPQNENSQSYLEYIQQQIRQVQNQLAPENAATLGEQALNQMIQEELIRQEADRRDITVSSEEIQEQIHSSFGYNPDATPEPTSPLTETESITDITTPLPTPTKMSEADFRQLYNRYIQESLKPMDISEQQYRSWIKASLLTEKVKEAIGEETSDEAEQVEVRVVSAPDEESLSEIAARLDAGEDFQTISDELAEEGTGYASELGWYPKSVLASQLGEELAEQAFNLEVGERTEPMALGEGQQYAIIEVTGHEVRPVEDYVKQQMAEQAFQTWLEAQQVVVERKDYQDRIPTEP